ncbi:HAMP domain-containing histidine kinase [Candidatus Roizmanbacteria bacterium]|nr:MAG: HAMP domain-containing histidine kinase [Candidatus Roizmanbacteria bacterium]
MSVSILFSGIIYRVLTLEITRFDRMHRTRIQEQLEEGRFIPLPPGQQRLRAMMEDPELVEESKDRVLYALIVLNSSIFVISGVLGYLLAGQTLLPIKEMTDEQKRFISDASHEIKTPLTSLKTAFEVFYAAKRKLLQKLKKSYRTVLPKLISFNLFLMHSSDSRTLKTESVCIDDIISIETVVNEATKKVSYLAKSKHIAIKHAGDSFTMKGNRDSIVDLVVIILDNAIKYSSEKSVIDIKTTNVFSAGTIEIQDYGMGIDKRSSAYF